MTSTDTPAFADGDRVTFTLDGLGVMRTTIPYGFTDLTVEAGDAGAVITPAQELPDGWLMVRPDVPDALLADLDPPLDLGELLFVPVHPTMIEPEVSA